MKKQILIVVTAFIPLTTYAQTSKRIEHFNCDNKVAIQGYNPVAYFKQSKAVKGKKEITASPTCGLPIFNYYK